VNGNRGNETEFELATLERLEAQGFTYVQGDELDRPHEQVVLLERLRAFLASTHPDLPDAALDEAARVFARPEGVDTLRRNMDFLRGLRRGREIRVEWPDGRVEHRHIHAVDWEHPGRNDFLVVNQLRVKGPQNDRRPDIVVFVNGLPLVLFELKNPWAEKPTVGHALNQIAHYRNDIPQIFDYSAFCVVSDGVTTLHGMHDAPEEWYAPWKSLDGEKVAPGTTASMKVLVEGLFAKDRLLDYIRNFIVFDEAGGKVTKKGAKYHQFFAVRLAVRRTLDAVGRDGEKRVGVIWHTTGSGKSLSMVFLVGILRQHPAMRNPTFVVQVDRTDLDDQLHDHFVGARELVGDVKQASSVAELRELLRTEGGEVIFTTIEKFRLSEEEIAHPLLSDRDNVVVIADEAHRSQYGFTQGYARYLAEALPNARRLGFTGTPVSFSGADTVEVFGDYIHTYDIRQAQEDGATVPIFYAPRQVRLHLTTTDLDEALSDIMEGEVVENVDQEKAKWAAMAEAAGARDRLDVLARDLLDHFQERTATLRGKAMAVCMTRRNCVRLYDALTALDGCPEVRVVMTGNLAEDPPEWSEAGHLTTKAQRDAIKARMLDVDDPLGIVIVCDMWLTGTDIPCLHTLYVDKPMRGHTMIQAISRVNRVFRDKPHGLIVDYIGIGHQLREATAAYTRGGGEGDPAPEISDEARRLFLAARDEVLSILPEGIDYGDWRRLSHAELEDRYALVFGTLAEDEERRDAFLGAESKLSRAFLLVRHLDECRPYANEVIFFQRARKQIFKTIPGGKPGKGIEQAVRDLVDDAVESEGVVDIFSVAGLPKADISILDDAFLQTFKDKPQENLRLKLLEQLLRDEITRRRARNLAKAKSFQELLEETLRRYHARLVDAAAVIQAMIEIRKEMEGDDQRASELGLDEDELAFYDAVATNLAGIYDQRFLADLIHQVVESVKRNLKVDWTQPHRESVKAGVRLAVKRVLRQNDVRTEDLERFVELVLEQAEALYRDWPRAA
jgi:type I restriction enzyme R subunit